MSFEVHREPLSKKYYTAFCSTTCAYFILYSFVLIILPLIIAYNSHDFWIKENYTLTQPQVTYTYLTNIQWYGTNLQTNQPMSLYYSTNAYLNQLYSEKVRFPILKSAMLDDNRDGIMERLELSVALPLQSHEYITGFDVVSYYQSQLNDQLKVVFDTVSYVNYESSTPMNKIIIDGDLKLKQSYAFPMYGGYKNLYKKDPLYDITSSTSAKEVANENILRRYSARNVSLVFQSNYQYIERRDAFIDSSANLERERYFNVSLTVRVPTQPVVYTPTLSSTLKFAWIQYMSFFIVIAFLLNILNSFIFRHKLLPNYSTADVIYEKMH